MLHTHGTRPQQNFAAVRRAVSQELETIDAKATFNYLVDYIETCIHSVFSMHGKVLCNTFFKNGKKRRP